MSTRLDFEATTSIKPFDNTAEGSTAKPTISAMPAGSTDGAAGQAALIEQMVRDGISTGDASGTGTLTLENGTVKKISYLPRAYRATADYFAEANTQRKAGNYGKSFVNGLAGFILTLLSVVWTFTGALPMLAVTAGRNGYNSWQANKQAKVLETQTGEADGTTTPVTREPSVSRTSQSEGQPGSASKASAVPSALSGKDRAAPGQDADGVSSVGTPRAIREEDEQSEAGSVAESVDGVIVNKDETGADNASDAEVLVVPVSTPNVASSAAKTEGRVAKWKRERAEKAAVKAEKEHQEFIAPLFANLKQTPAAARTGNNEPYSGELPIEALQDDELDAPKGVDVATAKKAIEKDVKTLVKLHIAGAKSNGGKPNYDAHVGTDESLRLAAELAVKLGNKAESADDVFQLLNAVNDITFANGGNKTYVYGQQVTPYNIYPKVSEVIQKQLLNTGLRATLVQKIESDLVNNFDGTPDTAAQASSDAMKNLRKALKNGYISAEEGAAVRLNLLDKYTNTCLEVFIENLDRIAPQEAQTILVESLDAAVERGLLTDDEKNGFLAFIASNSAVQEALVISAVRAATDDASLDVNGLAAVLADIDEQQQQGANAVLGDTESFIAQVTEQVAANREAQAQREAAATTIQTAVRKHNNREAFKASLKGLREEAAAAKAAALVAAAERRAYILDKAKKWASSQRAKLNQNFAAVQQYARVQGPLALAEQRVLMGQFTGRLNGIAQAQGLMKQQQVQLALLDAQYRELSAQIAQLGKTVVTFPKMEIVDGTVEIDEQTDVQMTVPKAFNYVTELREQIAGQAGVDAQIAANATLDATLGDVHSLLKRYEGAVEQQKAVAGQYMAQKSLLTQTYGRIQAAFVEYRQFSAENLEKLTAGNINEEQSTRQEAVQELLEGVEGTQSALDIFHKTALTAQTVNVRRKPVPVAVSAPAPQPSLSAAKPDLLSMLLDGAPEDEHPLFGASQPAQAAAAPKTDLFGDSPVSAPIFVPATSPRVLQVPTLNFASAAAVAGSLAPVSPLSTPGARAVGAAAAANPRFVVEERADIDFYYSAPNTPKERAQDDRPLTPNAFLWSSRTKAAPAAVVGGNAKVSPLASPRLQSEDGSDELDLVDAAGVLDLSALAAAGPDAGKQSTPVVSPRVQQPIVEEEVNGDEVLAEVEEADGDEVLAQPSGSVTPRSEAPEAEDAVSVTSSVVGEEI